MFERLWVFQDGVSSSPIRHSFSSLERYTWFGYDTLVREWHLQFITSIFPFWSGFEENHSNLEELLLV